MLHIQLIGSVKFWGSERAMATRPQLRKATAILAILALTEEHDIGRRQLARLLWSRNSDSQGLARLRDTLHRLRRGLDALVPGLDVLSLEHDRVALRRDRIWIDVVDRALPGQAPFSAEDVASDLNGVDPVLEAWLANARSRLSVQRTGQPAVNAMVSRQRKGPSIGIYPLAIIGIGIDSYLAGALACEITAALAGIRWLVVLPCATMAGLRETGGEKRAELGLDFALEGTLQRIGTQIRVCISLIDVEQESVAWSWRASFDSHDMLAVQEDAAAMLSAAVEAEVAICEAARARRLGNSDTRAYRLVLRAAACMYRLDYDSFMEGGRLIEEAIEVDPYYGTAHAWLALWNVFLGKAGQQSPHSASPAPDTPPSGPYC
jgi:TolB-like protein